VSTSLTTIVISVSVLHVAVFVIMIMIRLHRDGADSAPVASATVRSCVVCSEPAIQLGYDGLDPAERHDPHTGRSYSTDMAHYQPVCAIHLTAAPGRAPALPNYA
jgi:hypothetical protein